MLLQVLGPEYSVEGKALVCEALNIGFVIPIVLKKKLKIRFKLIYGIQHIGNCY
jgi:hypothetical protein